MFVFGGGKCPNLGVVSVRILGVVNVLLANDSQSAGAEPPTSENKETNNKTNWHLFFGGIKYEKHCQ